METLTGAFGVSMILSAYFLNLYDKIKKSSYVYLWLNFIGAFLASISSILLESIPFTILEGVWSSISLIEIIRKYNKNDFE